MARAQRIARNAEPLFQRLAAEQYLEFAFVSVANQNTKKSRRLSYYLTVVAVKIASLNNWLLPPLLRSYLFQT